MTAAREAECIGCDQPFDANGYCPRCEEYACEQPPPKNLAQVIAERPELQAYQAELRAKLFDIVSRGDPFIELERKRA